MVGGSFTASCRTDVGQGNRVSICPSLREPSRAESLGGSLTFVEWQYKDKLLS
jgi:hypothetical protein